MYVCVLVCFVPLFVCLLVCLFLFVSIFKTCAFENDQCHAEDLHDSRF